MHGCLSCLSLCGPVMDWRPVLGVPRLSPEDCWDRLQPPRDPTDELSGRKWMDGWMYYETFYFGRISTDYKYVIALHHYFIHHMKVL